MLSTLDWFMMIMAGLSMIYMILWGIYGKPLKKHERKAGEIMTYADAVLQVDKYKDLKPGWDGYRAPAFDHDVIDLAKIVLGRLGDGFEPGPCPDGSINLEGEIGGMIISVDISKK